MLIRQLTNTDLEAVISLFCDSFENDTFYAKKYPTKEKFIKEVNDNFSKGITFCIEKGYSLGVFEDEMLIAFLLSFNYKEIRNNYPAEFAEICGAKSIDELPYKDSFHSEIDALNGDTQYLISLAVSTNYRKIGLASSMLDYAMEKFPLRNFVSDVSNKNSLSLYEHREFEISTLDEDYFFVKHTPAQNATYDFSEKIKLIIPNDTNPTDLGMTFTEIKSNYALCGYAQNINNGLAYFAESRNSVSLGKLIEVDYQNLLIYQKHMNLSLFDEKIRGETVFLSLCSSIAPMPIINDTLEKMLDNRKNEWDLVSDIFVSIPVKYTDVSAFFRDDSQFKDNKANYLLKNLEFRTCYEMGIISQSHEVDEYSDLKKRIKRYYLGKIKIKITEEMSLENYGTIGNPIGIPCAVDLYITVDTNSSSAVISLFSLSSPFLISHFFDNVIRNQLLVVDEDSTLNLFDYLKNKYEVMKMGTPKIFSVIPKSKDSLSPSQVASLIASETIYPDGEEFGRIIDSDIMNVVNTKDGMGQYDRACIYAYNNVLLQFYPQSSSSVSDRLAEEAISLFFIELVLFEESAIHVADNSISKLLREGKINDPTKFLEKVSSLYKEYSKTIDFWDIQLNYPTSQNSVNTIRKAFKINEKHDYMIRNKEHLMSVFETECNIVDRKDSRRMDSSLAVISVLAIFSAWMDSHDYTETWENLLGEVTVNVIQKILFIAIFLTAGYVITHMLGDKIKAIFRRKRKK